MKYEKVRTQVYTKQFVFTNNFDEWSVGFPVKWTV